MFTHTQLKAFREARDACAAVRQLRDFAPKLVALAPEFKDKMDELDGVTDYVEAIAALALSTNGE